MAGTGAVLAPHAARPARDARGDCRGGRSGWRAGATLRQPFGINVRNGCRAVTRPEREPGRPLSLAPIAGWRVRVAGQVRLVRVCSRCDIYRSTYGLTFLIRAAASVLARATTATAPRNTRWVAVPRCRREGRAPPPDQSPTSRCPAHTSCSWPPAHLGSLPLRVRKGADQVSRLAIAHCRASPLSLAHPRCWDAHQRRRLCLPIARTPAG